MGGIPDQTKEAKLGAKAASRPARRSHHSSKQLPGSLGRVYARLSCSGGPVVGCCGVAGWRVPTSSTCNSVPVSCVSEQFKTTSDFRWLPGTAQKRSSPGRQTGKRLTDSGHHHMTVFNLRSTPGDPSSVRVRLVISFAASQTLGVAWVSLCMY